MRIQLPLLIESAALLVLGVAFAALSSFRQTRDPRYRALLLVLLGVGGLVLYFTVVAQDQGGA